MPTPKPMSLLARLQRDSYAIYGRTFEDDHEMTAEEMLEVACRAADAGDVEGEVDSVVHFLDMYVHENLWFV